MSTTITDGESGLNARTAINSLFDNGYIVWELSSGLTNERLLTSSSTVLIDNSVGGAVTFNVTGIGNGVTPIDYKESVKVATTANITLSGEQTIDGVLTSASQKSIDLSQ